MRTSLHIFRVENIFLTTETDSTEQYVSFSALADLRIGSPKYIFSIREYSNIELPIWDCNNGIQ